jgi:hypothetical protein
MNRQALELDGFYQNRFLNALEWFGNLLLAHHTYASDENTLPSEKSRDCLSAYLCFDFIGATILPSIYQLPVAS